MKAGSIARVVPRVIALVALVVAQMGVSAPSGSAQVLIREFPVASPNGPGPVARGPDGNIWFAEPNDDAIGRITPAGVATRYPLPAPYQEPRGIAAGPDGAVWFTETGSHTGAEGIGRIDPTTGAITEFPLASGSRAYGITTGPDGNLWFSLLGTWNIGQITPSGTLTTFPAPLQNEPLNLVTGPDGAVWFTEDGIVNGGTGAIGRITTSGAVSEFLLPTPPGQDSGAGHITVGPDGNLWFTWVTLDPAAPLGTASGSVGQITPSGAITQFPSTPANGWPPGGITSGPDGSLWFTENGSNKIGQMSPAGSLTEYAVPTPTSWPSDITVGSDGNLWFTEGGASKIGRLSLNAAQPVRNVSLSLRGHLVAQGRVIMHAGPPDCIDGVQVVIQRKVGRHWRAVGRDRSDGQGRFSIQLLDRTGWYRATVGTKTLTTGETCNAATSGTRHHLT